MAEEIVDGGEVEIDLADEGGIEGDCFQFDDHVAAKLEMIEQQIEVVVVAADLEMHLPADKCEAAAELDQKALKLVDQGLLDFTLPPRIGSAQEVKEVRGP
jgi:hypothetical protein